MASAARAGASRACSAPFLHLERGTDQRHLRLPAQARHAAKQLARARRQPLQALEHHIGDVVRVGVPCDVLEIVLPAAVVGRVGDKPVIDHGLDELADEEWVAEGLRVDQPRQRLQVAAAGAQRFGQQRAHGLHVQRLQREVAVLQATRGSYPAV